MQSDERKDLPEAVSVLSDIAEKIAFECREVHKPLKAV